MEAIGDCDWYSFRGMIGPGGSIGNVEERRAGDQVVKESTVSILDKLCCEEWQRDGKVAGRMLKIKLL